MAVKKRTRLTDPQIRLLELAMRGKWLRGSSMHQLADRLYDMGLIKYLVYQDYSKRIIATHDGAIVLKQNGYHPADPALGPSVVDPEEAYARA